MAPAGDQVHVTPEVTVRVEKRVEAPRASVVVVERRSREAKKRHRDRKYSDNILLPIGVLEHRILGGIARSASEYRHRSDDSARKRKDGAIRDLIKNSVRSSQEFFSQAARVPGDIVDSKPFNRAWGEVRRIARVISW